MPRLYYIRHGETDWNAEARLQGQREIPINEKGREQARNCGGILRDLFARDALDPAQFDFVASPLGRTRETMQIVRGELGLDPESYRTDDRLTEISFGKWEGFTLDELRRLSPAAVDEREADKWGFTPPEAESYRTMSLRVITWYRDLAHDSVVVAHGGVLRGLLVQLGLSSSVEAPFLDITQGVVFAIEPGNIARYT
jgi:broad specificity phosphatase PhoE